MSGEDTECAPEMQPRRQQRIGERSCFFFNLFNYLPDAVIVFGNVERELHFFHVFRVGFLDVFLLFQLERIPHLARVGHLV